MTPTKHVRRRIPLIPRKKRTEPEYISKHVGPGRRVRKRARTDESKHMQWEVTTSDSMARTKMTARRPGTDESKHSPDKCADQPDKSWVNGFCRKRPTRKKKHVLKKSKKSKKKKKKKRTGEDGEKKMWFHRKF